MSFKDLQAKVLKWAKDKDLLYSKNADKQFMKFIEEVFEFKREFNLWSFYKELKRDKKIEQDFSIKEHDRWMSMKDEMGDIFVTLIILCEQIGIDPVKCLEMAYEKIKDRKGKTINGNFYKQEDLEG